MWNQLGRPLEGLGNNPTTHRVGPPGTTKKDLWVLTPEVPSPRLTPLHLPSDDSSEGVGEPSEQVVRTVLGSVVRKQ